MPYVNDPYWGTIWYPVRPLETRRLANGDLYVPSTDQVIPFGASCPPGYTPTDPTDWRHPACLPMAGTRNVLYECGGLLAPLGSPGCETGEPEDVPTRKLTGGGCSPFGRTGGCGGMDCPPCDCEGKKKVTTTKEADFTTTGYGKCPTLGEQLLKFLSDYWWLLLLLLGFAFLREERKKKK